MRNIRAQRRAVLLGIFAAWIVSAAFIAAGVPFQVRTGVSFGTPARVTAFALSMAGLALVAGIGMAAASVIFSVRSMADARRPPPVWT